MLFYCVHRKTNGGNNMSHLKNRVTICNLICVVLLLALVAVQLFLPYWSYEKNDETVEVSLGEYVWFVKDHRTMTNDFKDVYGKDFKVDVVAYPHLYMLLIAGFGVVFCLLKYYSKVPILFGLVDGIMAVYYFSTNPVLQSGATWYMSLIVGIPLILLALFSLLGDMPAKLAAKKAAKA